MPIRRRHRVGRHLVTDDESGIVYYDDQVQEVWDGTIRKHYEDRHPQEFVRAGNDPYAVEDTRPVADVAKPCNVAPVLVGGTSIQAKTNGPAVHLFQPGVGDAEVGCTLVVYPDP